MNELSLYIPRKIYSKIMYWVNKSNFEVSWLGTINFFEKTGQFVVTDVFLLEQENTGASTDISAKELAKLEYTLHMKKKENPDIDLGELRWWGHSHVKMNVFWSGTDRSTMEELSQNGWFLSTVFNQKEEMRTAFTQNTDMTLMIDEINTFIYDENSKEDEAEWDLEYTEKVKNKTYTFKTKYNWEPKEKTNYENFAKVMAGELGQEDFEAILFSDIESKATKSKKNGVLLEDEDDINDITLYPRSSLHDYDALNSDDGPRSFGDQLIMDQIIKSKSKERRILPLKRKATLKKAQ